MKVTSDVVIIGGGIIGAACAYYLSLAGLETQLVERHFPASGTSRACDGLVLLWDKQEKSELLLAQKSLNIWLQLHNDLNKAFELQRSGTILLAERDAQMQAGLDKLGTLKLVDQNAEVLYGKDLRDLEPELAPDLLGGILFPNDLQVDPRRATLVMLKQAQSRSLKLHCDEKVIDIQRKSTGKQEITRVITDKREISTPNVVCAAGVWSKQIGEMIDLDVPIQPRKGHILVSAKKTGMIRHSLLEGGYATTVQSAAEDTQVAFVAEMTRAGRLLIGSSREFAGIDRTINLQTIQAIAGRAARFLPALAKTKIMRSYAGLRPWSPDKLPLIGPVEKVPGFYIASGHEGAGIGLAPITGQLIADMISSKEANQLANHFSPNRFIK